MPSILERRIALGMTHEGLARLFAMDIDRVRAAENPSIPDYAAFRSVSWRLGELERALARQPEKCRTKPSARLEASFLLSLVAIPVCIVALLGMAIAQIFVDVPRGDAIAPVLSAVGILAMAWSYFCVTSLDVLDTSTKA